MTASSPSATTVAAQRATPFADLTYTGCSWSRTTDHDLDRAELLQLAAAVATDSATWSRFVGFDDEHRHYANLHRDEHVDIWLLCWTPRNDTGWHDHDVSSGAVAVVAGRLVEHNLAVGTSSVATPIDAGLAFTFGPDHIHRLTGAEGIPEGTVSVHVYSPPLNRLGQYDVGPDGVLHRRVVPYTEELKASA